MEASARHPWLARSLQRPLRKEGYVAGALTGLNVMAAGNVAGRDMAVIYKETSQGGLAVNVPEC